MIRTIQMLFTPFAVWEKINARNEGVLRILALEWLPLLALTALVDGYALLHFGLRLGADNPQHYLLPQVVHYEMALVLGSLVALFLGAKLLQMISENFQLQSFFVRGFRVAAFGLAPFLLARCLNAIPAFNLWVGIGIGTVGCIYVLYHGISMTFLPEPTKAFGMYLVSVLILVILSVLVQLVGLMVIQGRFSSAT